MASYKQILVADELRESVQRAGGVLLQWRETLGELVRMESEGRRHRAG